MAKKSKIEYSNFVTLKEGKKFSFGDGYHACKCPNPECDLLIEWSHLGDGAFLGKCCGQEYEMYCEAVTFKHIGKDPRPDKSTRNRRKVSKVEVSRKPQVDSDELMEEADALEEA